MANASTPRCKVINCHNAIPVPYKRSMYSFPKHPEIAKKWIDFTQNEELIIQARQSRYTKMEKYKICSDHFEDICFRNPQNKQQGLNRGALPTILQIEYSDDTTIESRQTGDGYLDNKKIVSTLRQHQDFQSVLSEVRNNFDDDQDEYMGDDVGDDPIYQIKELKSRIEKFKTKEKVKSMRIASQLKTVENNKILIRRLRQMINVVNQKNDELEAEILQTRDEAEQYSFGMSV